MDYELASDTRGGDADNDGSSLISNTVISKTSISKLADFFC